MVDVDWEQHVVVAGCGGQARDVNHDCGFHEVQVKVLVYQGAKHFHGRHRVLPSLKQSRIDHRELGLSY